MESISPAPGSRAQIRRRQKRLLSAMLRALAQPLHVTRQVRRQIKNLIADSHLPQSVECLWQQLSNGAHVVVRRLNGLGRSEARFSIPKKNVGLRRRDGADAIHWSRRVIAACQHCASRLCELFRSAQAMEDHPISQLAYSLLRTLEKELWLLKSSSRPLGNAMRA